MKKNDIFLILFLIPSCAVGPNYKRPLSHPIPATFSIHCDASRTEPPTHWWEQFEDKTLNTLIKQAIQNNYDLQIALERIKEARALYQFQNAQLYPEINGISTIQQTHPSKALIQNNTTTPKKSHRPFLEFGIDASWELDFSGKLRHERNAQYFTLQAEIEKMHNVQIILIAEVAQNYITLCALKQKINLIQKQITIHERLVMLQKDLHFAGLKSEIDIIIQQQILASTLDFAAQLHTRAIQIHNQLALLLGLNPDQLTIDTICPEVPLSNYNITTGLPSDLIRRRPDIRQAERLLAAADENSKVAIAEAFPRFQLIGAITSLANATKQWFTGESLSWIIGPSIKYPFITFGRIQANIHIEESRNRQALLTYTQSIISALSDVENFLTEYFFTKDELLIITQKYECACLQNKLIYTKYIAGLSNELEYLESKSNEITTALELNSMQQKLSISLIGLYKALGGGW